MYSKLGITSKSGKEKITQTLKKPLYTWITFFIILGGIIFYAIFLSPPTSFPAEKFTFTIEKGTTLSQVSNLLKEKGLIRSEPFFKTIVVALKGEAGVRYGEYIFSGKENAWNMARRITEADFGLTPVVVTVFEGLTVEEMSPIFEARFPKFNGDVFKRIAKQDEGYLFPDTYRFLPNVGELEIYRTLKNNFTEKISGIEDGLKQSGKSLDDIVIMASLLEREARTTETRKMISGILWKRLEIGMLLQVDAVFEYINGKNTFMLTLKDLQIDSPYNTYKYKGLPKGPIANPGMDSILAAIYPKESPYLFYLSDEDGNIYYSRTFEGHLEKKARYIK
ncbi:hypothetical protein CL630_03340 [bacterium]|nr:hypothetical protein [bacterium]|tara:strand:- start:38429 stop:39436 length:1008 start_codon:yes stop_codon:yes gene_type:complete